MLIQEFIQALNSEIHSIRHGHGNSIKIFNGKLICKTSDFFIYKFHLENFLASLEDAPARITIHSNQFDCQILSVNGLELEIGVSTYSGQTIAEARLTTDLSYIYELLKTKFKNVLENELNVDFSLSESLFNNQFNYEEPTNGKCESCGKTVLLKKAIDLNCINCGKSLVNYLSDKTPPNSYQEKAIETCVQSKFSIIWGPPGTGKTQTIAKAIEAHIRLGRRVLLVSHANNAVDEALEKVAHQMRSSTFYNEGQLVRLGAPQAEHFGKLESQFPMVLPEKIIEELARPLLKEKEKLELQISEAKEHLVLIEIHLKQIEDIENQRHRLLQLQEDQERLKADWFRVKKELDALSLRNKEITQIINSRC